MILNRQFLFSYGARISQSCSERCLNFLIVPFEIKGYWNFYIFSDIQAIGGHSPKKMKVILLKSQSFETTTITTPSLQPILDEVLGKIVSLLYYIVTNSFHAAPGEQLSKLRSQLEQQSFESSQRIALSTDKLSHFDIPSLQGFQALMVMQKLLLKLRVSSIQKLTSTIQLIFHID